MLVSSPCVGPLRSVVSCVKRTREDAWPDDDDDDDENSPQPKCQLDLLDESEEMVASGNDFPGECGLVSLLVYERSYTYQ